MFATGGVPVELAFPTAGVPVVLVVVFAPIVMLPLVVGSVGLVVSFVPITVVLPAV